jgi:hypothetical protein
MKYQMMIRSRPHEDMFLKHDRFMAFLLSLNDEWGLKEGTELPTIKDPGTLPMRQVNLSKHFQKGIKAWLSYQNRKYHLDEGKFDDYFTLEFDPTRFDYESLATDRFEEYIAVFQAYRGRIGDEEFIQLDSPGSVSVEAKRSGVYRMYPICFFDKELCNRSFHLTPEEIQKRVAGVVERAAVVSNGVLIIASSKIVSIEEANALNNKLKRAIAIP